MTLLTQAPNNIPLINILLEKSSEVEPNGDNLPMRNLVLKLAVNKVQHILLHKYLLNLLTIVLPHYQQMSGLLNLRLIIKHIGPEPHIILQQKQPNDRNRQRYR